jgi:hypothetical protein
VCSGSINAGNRRQPQPGTGPKRGEEDIVRIAGIVLIVLGLAGVLYGGISWTHKAEILDAGPIEISRTEYERLPVPPIVGALLLIGGVVLVMRGGR